MKKSLLIILLAIAGQTYAQKLETKSELFTGYLTTTNFDRANTIKSIDGVLYIIYDDIPVALVRYPAMNPREEFEVPSSVRRICNNAFQGTKYLKTLKLHNVVSDGLYINLAIGEGAFNDSSIENFVVIENDDTALNYAPAKAARQRKEVARYTADGRPAKKDAKGLQIIAYDDQTAEKVIKK